MDTAYVKNNTFEFTVNPSKEWSVCFVSYPKKSFYFPLLLNRNSKIFLEVNKEFTEYKISGGKNAEEQNNFWQGLAPVSIQLRNVEKQISETRDSAKLIILKEKLDVDNNKINSYFLDWVTNHKSSPFSVAIIRLFIAKNPESGTEDTSAEKYFDSLLPEATENNSETDILEIGFAYHNDKYSKIQLGSFIPNFTVRDTSGKEIGLSDFKNKYLLIDFWASWCGPCRANNPELKKLYYKYKDRGLDVLSISLDIDAQKWKAAIKKDNMDWFQGSDLLGEQAGIGSRYRITAVPMYILIDNDGKIILKSIGGDINLVEEKLNKIFQ